VPDSLSLAGFGTTHAVVLGGAGFLGSHLCDRLVAAGATVTCIDNFATGSRANVAHLAGHERFTLVEHDITQGFDVDGDVDFVFNLASPASPVHYYRLPLETLDVGSRGTRNALDLALGKGAVFVHASTSEVYGDPLVNPQPESYWGNVNPIGPRSVYDEAKRFSEALTMAYHRTQGLRTRMVRIFNTYGPRMAPDDGRAVPEFFRAALENRPLPVHGDGSQTRSLCYVDDLIEGILRLALSDTAEPVNIGNPHELTMLELAGLVQEVVGTHPGVEILPRPQDDPTVRRPDITWARTLLGWEPQVGLREGLERTLSWFEKVVRQA
jgi:dTDP-glucose 4,6-dehydratase